MDTIILEQFGFKKGGMGVGKQHNYRNCGIDCVIKEIQYHAKENYSIHYKM